MVSPSIRHKRVSVASSIHNPCNKDLASRSSCSTFDVLDLGVEQADKQISPAIHIAFFIIADGIKSAAKLQK